MVLIKLSGNTTSIVGSSSKLYEVSFKNFSMLFLKELVILKKLIFSLNLTLAVPFNSLGKQICC